MITSALRNSKSERPVYSPANTTQGHQKSDVDRYLIERIECGCQNAMKILYRKYYTSLTSLINACLPNNRDKAALLNNSFLDIWSGQKVWDRRQSVQVFILSIVKKKINAFKDVIKRSSSNDGEMKSSSDGSDMKIIDSDIQHQLSYLSPAHKGLLFLLHKENLSYEQIATIENCSVDSIKKQFLDLLIRLKTPATQTPYVKQLSH